MKKLLAILAVCIALIDSTNAQPAPDTSPLGSSAQASIASAPVNAGIKAVPPQVENQELIAAKQQVKLLESQVAMLREFHGAILDTVYWALGGTFLVLSLLVGFGWFANLKVYDRDKQALQADLDAQIRVALSNLNSTFANNSERLTSVVDAKLEELAETIEYREEQMKKGFESSINSSLSYLQSTVANLKRDSLRHAIRDAPNPEEALKKAGMLLYYVKDEAANEIPDVISTIMKILEKGCSLSARDISGWISTLDSLPPEHAAFTDRLREKLVSSSLS